MEGLKSYQTTYKELKPIIAMIVNPHIEALSDYL